MKPEERDQGRGKRRGRQARRPDPGAGAAGAFADRLWRLRREAGDPSYAEMSARLGAAASKSSLASAVQGRKLPSWETTWEFVRVLAVDRLGRDPGETEREWRELWERARDADSDEAGGTGGSGADATDDGAADDAAGAETADGSVRAADGLVRADGGSVRGADDGFAEDTRDMGDAEDVMNAAAPAASTRSPRLARRGRVIRVVAALTVAAAVAAVAFVIDLVVSRPATNGGDGDPPPVPTSAPAAPPTMVPTEGAIAGDDSAFMGDITYPDGSTVRRGSSFRKVWRIRNTGRIPWKGRRLVRINSGPCRTPETVDMPFTAPGQSVDIAVRVRAPEEPGNCRIYWKVVDAQGRALFPAKRPIFLDVQVEGS
ncbi:NBR1-Ig-like domain-containing protein [Streptosporangium sp. NPDC004379]|uniref:NBR1-Ig-like domain-containing protein n=1 Tax=Streptosporangium sp. NPDC004379 TaxID=3366189 RepID=UPI0036B09162